MTDNTALILLQERRPVLVLLTSPPHDCKVMCGLDRCWRKTEIALFGISFLINALAHLLSGGSKMAAPWGKEFSRTARIFTSGVTKIAHKLGEEAFEIALGARFLTPSLPAVVLGLVLSAAATAKDTGYVFVSHEKTNNIAAIDPKQDYKIIKWISTSHRPRDMKFRDDHRLLYVACGDDDVIDVIDVATLRVVDHIPTGPSPEMFELSRDGKALYVSNEEGSSVQEISIADKIIVRDIATGAEPEGIAISTDGKTLYVTSEVTDMVHVVDAEAGIVTDNIVVGTRPRRLLLLRDGKELWVSNELSGQVSVIDRAANRVSTTLDFLPPGLRQVDVTPVGMTMTRDGKSAIVALGRANHIAFVDTATRKAEAYVLVGSRAWGVALSPDEKTLYVANGLSDDLSIVDMGSRKAIRAVPVGRVPHTVLVDD